MVCARRLRGVGNVAVGAAHVLGDYFADYDEMVATFRQQMKLRHQLMKIAVYALANDRD